MVILSMIYLCHPDVEGNEAVTEMDIEGESAEILAINMALKDHDISTVEMEAQEDRMFHRRVMVQPQKGDKPADIDEEPIGSRLEAMRAATKT